MAYERLLNKAVRPSDADILTTIGEKADLWKQIHGFIENNYDFERQLAFFSKNYGWTVRYRKGSKTLVSCFPETGAFSALLVLGGKEAEKVEEIREQLNDNFLSVFDQNEQLRDGRWLWIRIRTDTELDSLIKVISLKRKPRPRQLEK